MFVTLAICVPLHELCTCCGVGLQNAGEFQRLLAEVVFFFLLFLFVFVFILLLHSFTLQQ